MFGSKKKKEAQAAGAPNADPIVETLETATEAYSDILSDDTVTKENIEERNDLSENDVTENEPRRFELIPSYRKWKSDKELSESIQESMELVVSMIEMAVNDGFVEDDLFEILMRGVDYDNAVEEATLAGELRGRNARIEELMNEEAEGDGVPHPQSGSGLFNSRRAPSIFELAKECRI